MEKILSSIHELLLLHDCVIIPGFGGFVGNYLPAAVRGNQLAAPAKAIAFNRKLTSNDGLLIHHISEKGALNYVAAKRVVDQFVAEANYRLADGEKLTIPSVGELFYDDKENLVFEPQIDGNLNIDSFGLKTIRFDKLYSHLAPKPVIRPEDREAVKVLFQKRTIKKVLVAIPLLVALALIPIKNHEQLAFSDLNLLKQLTSVEVAKPVQPKAAVAETVPEPSVVTEKHTFFMIGGSFRDESNADSFIAQMETEGFSARNIGRINGLHYVSLASFESFGQAQTALKSYRDSHKNSGVWIYRQK